MSDISAKPQIEKTDLPNDPLGIPGMQGQIGVWPKEYAVWNGQKYPLGYVMWIGDFEYRAGKNGWEKTGNHRDSSSLS